jgi:hypothetical protein
MKQSSFRTLSTVHRLHDPMTCVGIGPTNKRDVGDSGPVSENLELLRYPLIAHPEAICGFLLCLVTY